MSKLEKVYRAIGGRAGYAAAPILTMLIVVASMAVVGITPFGDRAMLYDDAAIQHVGFLGWYHQVLHGEASIFYSFAKSLGGGTFTLFAYYLASPFNLLVYFFDPESIPQYVSLLIPTKLSLAALTCFAYLRCRLGVSGVPGVILACCYALAGCNLEAGSNFMWLDGVIMLPLACLGVHRLVASGSPFVLIASIGFTVLSNWYAGYMVCLASVGCFFAESIAARVTGRRFLLRGVQFAGSMVLGVALSMPLFLPVILEMLSTGGTSTSGFGYTLTSYSLYPDGLLEAIQSLFLGTNESPFLTQWGIRPGNFPLSSLLLALATSLFFLRSRASHRCKLVFGIALGFMILCVVFKPLDMIWTGFTRSDSYNPRYMFVIVFLLVAMSAVAFRFLAQASRNESFRALVFSAVLWIGLFLLFILDGWHPSLALLCLQAVLFAGLCWFLWKGPLVLEGEGGISGAVLSRACVSSALCFVLVFCVEAGCLQTYQMTEHYSRTSASSYAAYLGELSQVSPDYHEVGFYRLANGGSDSRGALLAGLSYAPSGENLALGIPGLSHYSSSGEQAVNDLLGNLGYCLHPGTRGITYYRSPLYLTDRVLGVNSVIYHEQPFGTTMETELSSYESTERPRGLYRYQSSLGIGFGVSEGAQSISWSSDAFDNQELWLNELTGESFSFYTSARVSSSEVSQESGSVVFRVTTIDDGPLYLQLSVPSLCQVWVDGEMAQTAGDWEFDTNVMYAGDCKSGDTVTVELRGISREASESVVLDARTLDATAADAAFELLAQNQVQLTQFTDTRVAGTYHASEEGRVLFTIPYRAEWTAYVDGNPVETSNLQGLLSVPVDSGDHEIVLEYGMPAGLATGVLVCVLALAGSIAWWLVLRRGRNGRKDGGKHVR